MYRNSSQKIRNEHHHSRRINLIMLQKQIFSYEKLMICDFIFGLLENMSLVVTAIQITAPYNAIVDSFKLSLMSLLHNHVFKKLNLVCVSNSFVTLYR